MNDLISRQAAIDALGGNEPVGDPSKMDDDDVVKMWERIRIINIINKLPSTQPTIEPSANCSEFPNNSDTISRQAAVEAMANTLWHYPNECYRNLNEYEFAKGLAELGLKSVPSAQPERQKGEWIDYAEDGYVECPFCHSATNCDGNKDELHFCFSCGADMRGEQDEAD